MGELSCYCPGMISDSYYWKRPLLTGAKLIITTNEITRFFGLVGDDYPSGFNAWRAPDPDEMKWSVPPHIETTA